LLISEYATLSACPTAAAGWPSAMSGDVIERMVGFGVEVTVLSSSAVVAWMAASHSSRSWALSACCTWGTRVRDAGPRKVAIGKNHPDETDGKNEK